MTDYRRTFQPGGTFFFTVVTHRRQPFLIEPSARQALHDAITAVRANHPFTLEAIVLLPDHLHCLWTLPPDDADFSRRWQLIKSRFSQYYRRAGGAAGSVSASRQKKQECGFWQRRFWEHTVRDEPEFHAICDYIHYNPVKHHHARCPHAWTFSSFHRFVHTNHYAKDWGCHCRPGKKPVILNIPATITGE